MTRTTLRGLVAHRLRLALAALAVVLGVSFVSGTLVLSDTLNNAFDSLFNQISGTIDVAVQGVSGLESTQHTPVPGPVLARVRAVDGVAEAFGELQRTAAVVGRDGKVVRNGGAPTIGVLWNPYPDLAALRLRAGTPPQSSTDVVIDARTAQDQGLHPGSTVRIELPGSPPQDFRVSGLAGFGSQDNLLGATLVAFDSKAGPALLGAPNEYDLIAVRASPGVTATELRQRIAAVLPGSVEAITGRSLVQQETDQVGQGIGFLTTFILVFAAVALLVGSFIILNTFSIIVAQRQRELALLRCLGATRGQVLRSVLLEALIVGAVASGLGIGLGLLLARGLEALLSTIGLSISGESLQLTARTVIWCLVVGIGVTVVASMAPARRATRVAPVEALRDSVPTQSAVSARRVAAGLFTVAAGVAVLCMGLFVVSNNQLLLTGVGVLLVFLGVAVLAAVIARPAVAILGAPIGRFRGVAGKLAQRNARRQPRRTASTASALMIGVGLVSCFAVFAASLKDSVDGVLDRTARADFIITSDVTTADSSLNTASVDTLRADTDHLAAVSPIAAGRARVNGSVNGVEGFDPATVDAVLSVDVKQGAPASALGDSQVALSESAAKSIGAHVGSVLTMEFPRPGTHRQTVATVYADNPLLGDYLVTLATFRATSVRQGYDVILVRDAAGVAADQARAAIQQDLQPYPGAKVQSQDDYKKSTAQQIDQLLGILYALLALALVIALLGIVNTLVLSIVERTRELGLVRALGMDRRGLRTMVRWESVIIAMFGTLLGIGVGIGFGAALVRAASSQGITQLTVPASQLVVYVVLAIVFGLLAAIPPARRAARIDMLQAITTE